MKKQKVKLGKKFRKVDVLTVAPDEVLVVRVPNSRTVGDSFERLAEMRNHLDSISLANRFIVFSGDVEFSKVEKP